MVLNWRKLFSDQFSSPKLNLSGKMNPKFSSVFVFECYLLHMTDRILTYGYKTRYLQKIVVYESLTGLLGWQFNSNFVLDNCRERDLSFLRIEKTISKLIEVIGDC